MRRFLLAAAVLLAAAFAAVWFVPQVQDALIRRVAEHRLLGPPEFSLDENTLSVLLCGTGTPLAHPTRGHPCNAVIAGGRVYLVDVGPGATTHLNLMRVPMDRVAAVLFTHFHSDHIGDLGEINLQSFVAGRSVPLRVFGPRGVERVVAGFTEAYALDTGYRIAHHGKELLPPELSGMQALPQALGADGARQGTATVLEENGLKITAILVHHQPVEPAFGYRFDYRGRSLVISGDTAPFPPLAEAAKDADVLVHEAQANHLIQILHDVAAANGMPRQAKILADIPTYHTSPVDAAKLARQANVKLLVLSHLGPPPFGRVVERAFVRGVDGTNPPAWRLGDDGMVVELPGGSQEVRVRSVDWR